MIRWQRALGWTALVIATVIGGGIALVSRLLPNDLCETEIFSELPSPSGKLTAVVYEIDCDATTGFSRQVAIVPTPKQRFADDMLARGFFAISLGSTVDPRLSMRDPLVQLRWGSENQLDIAYPKGSRLIRSSDRSAMIGISYQTYRDAPGSATP
jgi:hypothetical protein